ncbi:retrovirus-related pol polyprotein from transposon TNT 1-94 [Tanacetum coccineum]
MSANLSSQLSSHSSAREEHSSDSVDLVQSKEHCDSLIAQINGKSIENSDLNAQLQEKVFAITALKNELTKLKGKNVVNTVVSKPNVTLAPGMFKLYIEPIYPRLKNNMNAHEIKSMLIKLKWIYKVKTDDFGGVLKNKARLAQGFRKVEGINFEESFAPVVPSTERVKISSTNIRLETTIPQKEETFQVIIEVIKNSTCFKAFTISVDVPEIFMQQFWTILNICPIVEGEDFIDVPDNDTALTFLINLGLQGGGGGGSKGKKTAEESQETVDVSKESEPEPEPEPAKKKTSSKRRVKKNVTLSADDNIISDDPDVALELAKSISQTKAEEAKAARKVHATHARIVTESIPESDKKKSNGRSSKSVVIQDTSSTPKSKPATLKTKLKGALSLTPQE